MKTYPRLSALVLSAALVGAASSLAGCNSTRREHTDPTNYYTVYLTGSHIPMLIPKNPETRVPPTVSPITILTREEFERATATAGSPMH